MLGVEVTQCAALTRCLVHIDAVHLARTTAWGDIAAKGASLGSVVHTPVAPSDRRLRNERNMSQEHSPKDAASPADDQPQSPSSDTRRDGDGEALQQSDTPGAAEPDAGGATAREAETGDDPLPEHTEDGQPQEPSFPVVGVGASAGGLPAFQQLLQQLPADPGVAVIFVQHLSPQHASNLEQILSRETELPVQEATSGVPLKAGHVYVIPSNRDLMVYRGTLQLMNRTQHPARHMPVDSLFRSMAEDLGRRAIGVVLSGTGSDGVEGIKAIKAAGGFTLAQDEKSAGFAGMPQSAQATGQVDLVLPPPKIAQELARLARHPHLASSASARQQVEWPDASEALSKIFFMLRRDTGVDFSQYKRTTVQRRIARRMVLHKIDTVKQYLQFLQRNSAEVRALFDEMLITVTSFFRDPESFATLKKKVFPQMVRDPGRGNPVRVWVPACSTGEEAYSLAIALLEYLDEREIQVPIQVFATDVSESAIHRARQGRYPENIAGDLNAERLRRFFTKSDVGYQVNKVVRDVCVFARQDVLKEPPFSNLDLLSCRNLLIYLGPSLQKRLIPTFHYALRPGGYLMLGRSETIGGFADLFSLLDREQKIYAKKAMATRMPAGLEASDVLVPVPTPAEAEPAPEPAPGLDLERQADELVLSEFAPPGVIINEDLEILQFRGRVGNFIAPSPGNASLNLMRMACPELKLDLRALIHQVRRERQIARKENLTCMIHGAATSVDLEVHPLGLSDSDRHHFLVLFRETVQPAQSERESTSSDDASLPPPDERDAEISRLRQELQQTKAALQDIVEDQDATNEELRAANEEIQSSNEELQSTNEELETAKEELQSSNEELLTLNAELEHQYAAANQAIDDFDNLHRSVGIPVILLDHELRIRRFTPPATQYLGLRDADCGRRIGELRLGIRAPNGLEGKIRQVFDTLNTLIEEVQSEDGRWYSLQVRPYRTAEDRITGAVVVLIDITEHRRALDAQVLAESVVATVRQPMVILDADLKVTAPNRSFFQTFEVTSEETVQRPLSNLGDGQWDYPDLHRLLEEIIPQNESFEGFEIVHEFPKIGRKRILLDARRIEQKGSRPHLILLCFSEISDA